MRFDREEIERFRSIASELIESSERKRRESLGIFSLFLTKEKREGFDYVIQRIENKYYGWALVDLSGARFVFPGYPHLRNINPDDYKPGVPVILEHKYNGTNIGIWNSPYGLLFRTRRSILPNEFQVPTLFLSEIKSIRDEEVRRKLLDRLNKLKEMNLPFMNIVGEGDYVGIKVREAIQYVGDLRGIDFTKLPQDKIFFFEFYGGANVIMIDEELKHGIYPLDNPLDLVLIDVFDMNEARFLSREEKEELARAYNLPLPEVFFEGYMDKLVKDIDRFRKLASSEGIEGFVVKSSEFMLKLKSDEVLDFARRGHAIMKGYILPADLLEYCNRAIESTISDFRYVGEEEFKRAVESAMLEAYADYPRDLVDRKRRVFEEEIARQIAIRSMIPVVEQWKESGMDRNEMFRKLNYEMVRRLPFISRWVNIDEEKRMKDVDKREYKRMKERRKRIMNPVINVIIRREEKSKTRRKNEV